MMNGETKIPTVESIEKEESRNPKGEGKENERGTGIFARLAKMGSLFDGSGGFPLAGALCGIEPIWASEIEPYPIAVTKIRFPNMKHLGDVSKINGANIEPVDIITFGSPCQDMSVAGKRAGLKHESNGDKETTRSGLFMEAVRIIKEMREATNGEYPKYCVWENVPGAFTSNKGEDFRTVLEELIKIVEPSAIMPSVPKNGWAYADSYVGDGWSLAYRVFDAQYIRTAQRRRRIYLVLDLRGQRARTILFERESLRGYSEEGGTPWQGTSSDAQGSVGADDCKGVVGLDLYNFSASGDKAVTLNANSGMSANHAGPTVMLTENDDKVNSKVFEPKSLLEENWGEAGVKNALRAEASKSSHCVVQCVAKEQSLFENHSQDTRYKGPLDVCLMLPAQLGTGGNNTPFVVEQTPFCKSHRAQSADDATTWKHADKANTLNNFDTGEARANELVVEECPAYCLQGSMIGREDKNGPQGNGVNEDSSFTLNTIDRHAVAYPCDSDRPIAIDRAFFNQGQNALYEPQTYEDGTNPTIVAKGPSAVCYKAKPTYIVRRLTPMECARLQGFPDEWGRIESKRDLTDEEYAFWFEVRNTYAAANGKRVKDYTKKQMLTWYSKLHTDSAEYKMWGNGIALPCAFYVMQGIAERYIVEGVAFFDGKWHCCDNGHEWFAVGSDYCLPADAAKRMLIRLCDDGEKVVDLTRCENVSTFEEDEE